MEEDSVIKDIKGLKSFFSKYLGKLGGSIKPMATKSFGAGGSVLSSGKNLIGKSIFKKLVIVAGVIAVLGLVVFFALKLFKNVSQRKEPDIVVNPSPTPLFYQPENPSIYATDPEVLMIEQDINILEREMSTTVLRESTLNPPSLDFDIKF